jgi:hypothetical protein
MERRGKVYVSDWTDGFKNLKKVVPAILFLYFACLSPAVSFGTIASQITNDSMGVVEFLLSAGTSGMVRCSRAVLPIRLLLGVPHAHSPVTFRHMQSSVGNRWRSSRQLVLHWHSYRVCFGFVR